MVKWIVKFNDRWFIVDQNQGTIEQAYRASEMDEGKVFDRILSEELKLVEQGHD